MDLSRLTGKKWNYPLLTFLLVCTGVLFVMIISGYHPFGKYSMLYSDMYHQYYPFFVAFRRALLSGDSLLYSWDVGLGMDYLGLYAYYLASPLNLLSILVPEPFMLAYFSLLVPIKLGLAGAFFTLFLQKLLGKEDLFTTLFGCFYGLCAWALGYQWNVMWLDTFALLPLVVLGMVRLLSKRRFLLYTLTLALSIGANYYIGLFTCIFILLLFFCYEICCWKGFQKFFADLFLMAVFSLLAIGLTAIIELPALAALQTTQSSVNQFPKGFRMNIAPENTWLGLLQAMVQVAGNLNGGLEPTFKEGLPNLYCGVITNILAFIFLTCPKIRVREKLCCAAMLLFFCLSFILRQLDYIWHGFHFTNMIPYRFSFLFSFVLLYMAYRAFRCRNRFKPWQLIFAGILTLALILCNEELANTVLWAYNAGFLALYTGALLYGMYLRPAAKNTSSQALRASIAARRSRREVGGWILVAFMIAELVLNLVNFGLWFPGTYVVNYPLGKEDTQNVLAQMEHTEADTLFYRAETTHSQTLNDGAINGYHGVSAFTSSANVKTTVFMQSLGYSAKNTYNRYCFEESSPVSNLFLGLKYMIEREGKVEENPFFTDVYQSGDVHLLENKGYLPLGFLAQTDLASVRFSTDADPFLFQNDLFSAATGYRTPIWHILDYGHTSIFSSDVTIDSQLSDGLSSYTCPEDADGTLTYRYQADREGLLCINLDLSKRNRFSVWKNGTELYSETISLPQMLSVSSVKPGDEIELRFTCKSGETGTLDVTAAIMDESLFWAGYAVLNRSTMTLTKFSNTFVEGIIDCDRDGLLYTSIPQNGNWAVTVDGAPTEITLIGDVMIGIYLEEGPHSITFRYTNPAFSLGWKVSLACLVIAAIVAVLQYKNNRYKGKHVK